MFNSIKMFISRMFNSIKSFFGFESRYVSIQEEAVAVVEQYNDMLALGPECVQAAAQYEAGSYGAALRLCVHHMNTFNRLVETESDITDNFAAEVIDSGGTLLAVLPILATKIAAELKYKQTA